MRRAAASRLLPLGVLLAGLGALVARPVPCDETPSSLEAVLRPFLETHCVRCHAGPGAQAGLALDRAWSPEAVRADAARWQRLVGRLRRGEMPPPGEARPSDEDREAVLARLGAVLEGAAPPSTMRPGRVTLRRLNRTEYARSVRDLLGVDVEVDETFPADDVGYGFDRVGDVLALPPVLLEKYLLAAERVSAQAVPDEDPDLPVVREVSGSGFEAHGGARQQAARGFWVLFSTAELTAGLDLPREGRYRLRARALGQQAGDEPARMAFIVDGRVLETVDVAAVAPAPGTYTVEARVPGGARRFGLAFVNDYYRPDAPDPEQRDRNLVVFDLRVEGPLDRLEPVPGRPILLPEPGVEVDEEAHLRTVLGRLARRAWRTHVGEEDLAPLLAAIDAAAPASARLGRRLQLGIQMILVSPRFLFRFEVDPAGAEGDRRPLSAYEVASRLASFLWSSLPDDALLDRAADGSLLEAEALHGEVDRLLDDARASSLAESFAPQWLQVQDVTGRTPDPERFPGVDSALLAAMREETMRLFEAILREDRDVRTLLSADFTFVNEPLARHYGLPGVRGSSFRRVPVPPELAAGVLAHASVLTATSNPTRTSPVKRGKWILEALLDAPSPPPPPGVGVIDESRAASEASTLRERLERHRSDPACAVCHDRLDPLGFALEGFDAVGRRRSTDENGRPVDARGTLPDGRVLAGVADLRAMLVQDRSFLRALARHLLVYALGRGLEDADHPALDRLVAVLEARPTLRALVHAIVDLEAFRETALAEGAPRAAAPEEEGT